MHKRYPWFKRHTIIELLTNKHCHFKGILNPSNAHTWSHQWYYVSFICRYIHVYMCISHRNVQHILLGTYIQTCEDTYIYTNKYIWVHMYTYEHMNTYEHVYRHINTYVHIYIHAWPTYVDTARLSWHMMLSLILWCTCMHACILTCTHTYIQHTCDGQSGLTWFG
jgi:hypothetical protein